LPILILADFDPKCIPLHAVAFILDYDFLFKSVLGHCECIWFSLIKLLCFVLKTIVIFVVTVHSLAGQAQASSLVRAVQCSLVRVQL
jgi:hypothetical protein